MRERPNHMVAGLMFVGICIALAVAIFFLVRSAPPQLAGNATVEAQADAAANDIDAFIAADNARIDAEESDQTSPEPVASKGNAKSANADQYDTACFGEWAYEGPSGGFFIDIEASEQDTPVATLRPMDGKPEQSAPYRLRTADRAVMFEFEGENYELMCEKQTAQLNKYDSAGNGPGVSYDLGRLSHGLIPAN